MAQMDYQINNFVQNGTTTVASVTYHTGATAAATEEFMGVQTRVTRYRRSARVATDTITKTGTLSYAQLVPFLNTALATRASALGHTPISEQTNS